MRRTHPGKAEVGFRACQGQLLAPSGRSVGRRVTQEPEAVAFSLMPGKLRTTGAIQSLFMPAARPLRLASPSPTLQIHLIVRRSMRLVPACRDDIVIQGSILARPIAPRYIGRYAVELQFSPDLLVMERVAGPAQGTGESFARDWTKLEAGRRATGNVGLVGVNDCIRKAADP